MIKLRKTSEDWKAWEPSETPILLLFRVSGEVFSAEKVKKSPEFARQALPSLHLLVEIPDLPFGPPENSSHLCDRNHFTPLEEAVIVCDSVGPNPTIFSCLLVLDHQAKPPRSDNSQEVTPYTNFPWKGQWHSPDLKPILGFPSRLFWDGGALPPSRSSNIGYGVFQLKVILLGNFMFSERPPMMTEMRFSRKARNSLLRRLELVKKGEDRVNTIIQSVLLLTSEFPPKRVKRPECSVHPNPNLLWQVSQP